MINKKHILIICEGFEEYEYLTKIITLGVWNNYNIKLINAMSNTSIFSRYQYAYNSDNYDLILIMTDTDRPTYEDFKLLMNKIDNFHDCKDISNEIVIFGNPCTMQFILNHFSSETVYLTKSNKKKNSTLIESLAGIKNYDAHSDQRKILMDKITIQNYNKMKRNISSCFVEYNKISSTNFLNFINNLESNNYKWIDDINKKLNN